MNVYSELDPIMGKLEDTKKKKEEEEKEERKRRGDPCFQTRICC